MGLEGDAGGNWERLSDTGSCQLWSDRSLARRMLRIQTRFRSYLSPRWIGQVKTKE